MSSKFAFDKKAEAFQAAVKVSAIEIMKATKKHFSENFEKEEFDGQKYEEVARRTAGSNFNKGRIVGGRNKPTGKGFIVDQGDDYATRKILAGTSGRLRYKTERADSSISMNGQTSVMFNPVPYAQYINDGTAYMKARPFMKQDEQLTKIQLTILSTITGKIWQIKP